MSMEQPTTEPPWYDGHDDDDDTRDVSDTAISLNLEGHTTLDFDLLPYKWVRK